MGKINQGILGGFSGKVGSVIGGSWKGVAYMRGISTVRTKSNTLQQLKHRAKFATVMLALQPLTPVLREGFKQYAQGQTAFNAAMSCTFQRAISGEYPNYTIHYPDLLISRGSLAGVNYASAEAIASKIKVTWENNSGGAVQPTDKALVLAINPAKGQAAYLTEGAARDAQTEELAVSPHWSGDTVEVYLAFLSENGSEVSNSSYLGSVTVV